MKKMPSRHDDEQDVISGRLILHFSNARNFAQNLPISTIIILN